MHLMPLLTIKGVYLLMRWELYRCYVQSCMLHGSETWPVKKVNVTALRMG